MTEKYYSLVEGSLISQTLLVCLYDYYFEFQYEATFKGIIKAIKEFAQLLLNHKVRIFVRRAGPNYQEGLKLIRNVGETLGLDMHVFGPEMFVTGIVPLALKGDYQNVLGSSPMSTISTSLLDMNNEKPADIDTFISENEFLNIDYPLDSHSNDFFIPFTNETRSFVYGTNYVNLS